MRFNSKLLLAVAVSSLIVSPVGAKETRGNRSKNASADSASFAIKDPDKFLHFYYSSIKKADKLSKLLPFYTKEQLTDMDEMKKQGGPGPGIDMDGLMLEMLKSEQPKEVKIISAKRTASRVEYKLEPASLPPDKTALKKKGNFTMTGEAVLVKEDGRWKIYKDFWQSKTKDENGSFSSSFGINPDRKRAKAASGGSAAANKKPKDFSSQFRDKFFHAWKPSGTGTVMAAMLVGEDGKIRESYFKSKRSGEKGAVEAVRKFVSGVTGLPPLPDKLKAKPYAWMSFSWSEKGARAISGPYFDKEFPDWVTEQKKKI